MAILSIGSVSKSFGENTLFQNVSFSLEAKDKVGFIGSNGAGKTTLFKILTGSETPDSGTVSKSQQLSIGYMEQYALKNSETTLFDEVLKCFSYLAEIEAEHEKVTRQISLGLDIDEYIRKQHELSEKFEALGGLTYRSRTRSMLMGLGFTDDDMLLPVASLSGGEKTRASLAKLLLSGHNLLLLDEPTNHLDMEATAFLENYLAGFDGAIIVISHDRYFLDRVTTKTFELKNRRFTVFDGSYSVYSAFSKKNEAVLKKHYENDMREIHRIEGIIKQQRQWNRERNIKTAESKQKILDRKVAELVVPESESRNVRIDFSCARQSGNDVLYVSGVSKSFEGKSLFKNVNMDIKSGECVFLLGGNGCGKTTLMNILMGREKKDSGEIRFGTKLDIGYYDQHFADLHESSTVISEIRNAYPRLTDTEIRNYLAGFLFCGDDVFKEISCLSGGERARVALLKLMLAKPNLLLLDEPTNHLDIPSREALEDALLSYDGTALIVSHDRYFINKLAEKIYKLDENGTHEYCGNYDYYLEKSLPQQPKKIKSEKTVSSYELEKKEKARRQKAERTLKKAEEDIAETEKLLEELKIKLQNTGADYVAATEISEEIAESEKELDKLYGIWEEASAELE